MLLRLQLLKQNKEYFDESVLSDSDTWIKERKQKIRSKCFIYGQSALRCFTHLLKLFEIYNLNRT